MEWDSFIISLSSSLLSRMTLAREGKWRVISVASFEMEDRLWDMGRGASHPGTLKFRKPGFRGEEYAHSGPTDGYTLIPKT